MARRLQLISLVLLIVGFAQIGYRVRQTLWVALLPSPSHPSVLLTQPPVGCSVWRQGRWLPAPEGGFVKGETRVLLHSPGFRDIEVAPDRQRAEARFELRPNWLEALAGAYPLVAGLLGIVAGELLQRHRPTPTSASQPPVAVRETVGPYTLLSPLGRGATAEVFLAEPTEGSGPKAALKMMFPEVCRDEDFRTRFEREAQLCQKMNHPRIVHTYAWGDHNGRYWMAQQYLPGQSLQQWVRPGGRHPREVRRLLAQIAEGLAYAHSLGVYHRDLKPENILLTQRGEPVIADFGMARSMDFQTITQDGTTVGTPAYMAPEQIEGQKLRSGSADLYSLGIMGYELLIGFPPFQGDLMQVIMAHLTAEPLPLRARRSDIPEELERLVMALLHKDPEGRPGSAAELVKLLA